MKKIILGVSGCIAAYKACSLISRLRKEGHEVRVIMTENAKQFITPLTLATLSGHPVMDNMWNEIKGHVDHIDIAKWADLFVVYPATANIMAKFANGIADDLLSTVYLAIPRDNGWINGSVLTRVVIFPAMNSNMLAHPAVERNAIKLLLDGNKVTPTREGELACGDVGKGCLLNTEDAMELLKPYLGG